VSKLLYIYLFFNKKIKKKNTYFNICTFITVPILRKKNPQKPQSRPQESRGEKASKEKVSKLLYKYLFF
jgi:hypothetical protein